MAILIKANLYLNINRVNLNPNLDGRIIALTINFDVDKQYTFIYVLNNEAERQRFLREVHSFMETLETPCVIAGVIITAH